MRAIHIAVAAFVVAVSLVPLRAQQVYKAGNGVSLPSVVNNPVGKLGKDWENWAWIVVAVAATSRMAATRQVRFKDISGTPELV